MPATGNTASVANTGSSSANATVMAASAQLTVYIHQVARSSSLIRVPVVPSKRPMAIEIATEVSGTTINNDTVAAATAIGSELPHQRTNARNSVIANINSAANSEALKINLYGALRRTNSSSGTLMRSRASKAAGAERYTSANAVGISESEKRIASWRNSTLKTTSSKKANSAATITNDHHPVGRAASRASGSAAYIATVAAAMANARATTWASGRRSERGPC